MSLSLEELKGKQSVRTTFRLPEQSIKMLNILAAQLGLKQKSLFEQLMEDEDALNAIAESVAKKQEFKSTGERRAKTYVLNKKSLDTIEKFSRKKKVPRDVLVEMSLRRLLPVITSEQEKNKFRSAVYKDVESHLDQGKKLYKKAEQLLGEDDAICEMIKRSNREIENNVDELKDLIEKGKAIEKFEVIGT